VRITERCSCRVELVLEGDDCQVLDAHLARWRVNHMRCHGINLTVEQVARYQAGHPFPDRPAEGSLEWLSEQYARVREPVHVTEQAELEGDLERVTAERDGLAAVVPRLELEVERLEGRLRGGDPAEAVLARVRRVAVYWHAWAVRGREPVNAAGAHALACVLSALDGDLDVPGDANEQVDEADLDLESQPVVEGDPLAGKNWRPL